MTKFCFIKNTDSFDIRQKSLGISVWSGPGVNDQTKTHRGLKVQVRHNGDRDTFQVACKVSQLLVASPQLLEGLRGLVNAIQNFNPNATVGELRETLNPYLTMVVDPAMRAAKGK